MQTLSKPSSLRWALPRPTRRPLRRLAASRSPDGELSWDPEGLFGSAGTGHIARREMQKRLETDKDFASSFAEARSEIQKEALARRMARVEPEDEEGFIEYFLNTDMEDMQYEVSRWRPQLTPSFFSLLDQTIGTERFSNAPDEDRLAELESLRTYLEEAVGMIDQTVDQSSNVGERLKKLLTAKDKKAMILDMVSANEIDSLLIEFMDQNIQAAKTAKETQKAEFMEKLRDACKRYA